MVKDTITASLHSAGKDRDCGTLKFTPLDKNERYWEVELEDARPIGFFREVWPLFTMGEMCKMPASKMKQLMWSAYGYGVTVKVKDDTIW